LKEKAVRNLKKLLLVLIFLAVAAVVLVFVLENQQAVALSFLGWSSPSLPVSVFVLAGLLAGMLLGPLFGWYIAAGSKRRWRKQLRSKSSVHQRTASSVPAAEPTSTSEQQHMAVK
jgi:putative membrane protein